MDAVFLGANDVGWECYEWLCERESVAVRAMLTDPDQLKLIEELEPDVVVACGFDHVVPPEILAVPEEGCLNLHPGLLPETRGYNPNVWSIVEDLPAGATLHYMDEGIDTGDVVARREVERRFDDTGRDLYERIEAACVELFTETWPAIEAGEVEATSQDEAAGTYHVQAEFEELCRLDPEAEYSVQEMLDRLRALTFPPFDNAFVEVDGERYYVEVDITREDDAESGSDADSAIPSGHLDEY